MTVVVPRVEAREDGRFAAALGGVHVLGGPGCLAELGALAAEQLGREVLLVTDRGVQGAGHSTRAIEALERAGTRVAVFDAVEINPTTEHVRAGVAFLEGRSIDGIVALGGGSVMDCAKGINLVATNGGRMEDYRGYGRATRPLLPAIAVPTTAGTGSDAQSYAVIADARTRTKMACGDPRARFRAALLDPHLLAGAPPAVAAAAGIDAVTHAVESFVCTRANPISRMLAAEAWRLLDAGFEPALAEPPAPDARMRMLLGAHFAGAAIEQSMLGAAHASANPLTSRHGLVHGAAVGLMLPWVMRFNLPQAGARYDELARCADPAGDRETLLARVAALLRRAAIPARLRDHGIPREGLVELAADAAGQWTGGFNPRPVARDDFLALYEAAW